MGDMGGMDNRGTIKDWPIALVIGGVGFLFGAWFLGAPADAWLMGWGLLLGGLALLLIRGGVFTARRR